MSEEMYFLYIPKVSTIPITLLALAIFVLEFFNLCFAVFLAEVL